MHREWHQYHRRFHIETGQDEIDWSKKDIEQERHDRYLRECCASTGIDIREDLRQEKIVEEVSGRETEESDHRKKNRWGTTLEWEFPDGEPCREKDDHSWYNRDDESRDDHHSHSYYIIFWWNEIVLQWGISLFFEIGHRRRGWEKLRQR